MVPYWSAVTDAFVKKDFVWIKKSFRMLTSISLIFIVGIFIMYFFADKVFELWLDDEIIIPSNITIGVGIFVGGFILTETVMQILNGIGEVKIQAYLSIVIVVINIPIAILLSNTFLGITGVIIAPVISRTLKFIFALIQYNKIMTGKTNSI
jgi:Na+-driven multidrug efflux pump